HGRRHPFSRVVHRGQPVEARVGHLRNPDEGLTFAVGGAAALFGARHQLKQCRFAARTEANKRSAKHWSKPRMVARAIFDSASPILSNDQDSDQKANIWSNLLTD